MLRIAVPNKGSLSERASAMLREAGYRQRKEAKELVTVDPGNRVEFFYLRPRDIAVYVGAGRLDLGITGRDLLLESGVNAEEVLALGFARSTFRYAVKPGSARGTADFDGMTIATSYENIVAKHLANNGIQATVVHLDGAVETAVELGVAQVVADVVETGTSLRNAGLEVIGEPIMESEAILVRRPGTDDPGARQFLRRLQGVLVAGAYVMMDYDCRAEHLEDAVALTPGLEAPTVSPLHNEGWVAVRAMVPAKEAQQIMDDLYALGARAILTTAIHACRL
ncbi:ATP phosphoribosyltransferase [Streptomyces flavotricini]|uniref:ATP phosphoribosyltransferase n=1 Tax=Streptomyces flavotricini TaxID=66888 RepID=A0ABS8EEN3_9ACTN|nr:ATP phosphoribosyltransferase [Streptomyces flavotricini]MCC0099513.1 ATP phosphoribosyltransferase [Streptomyces flavotricini]